MMLVERKACCHVANAFLSRLELITMAHIQAGNIQNVSKMCFLGEKAPGKKKGTNFGPVKKSINGNVIIYN